MSTAELDPPVNLGKQPDPTGVLHTLRPAPRPPVDVAAPVLPAALRDRTAFTTAAALTAARTAYRAKRLAMHTPVIVGLLLLRVPWGVARVVAMAARWIYDSDTAALRHAHAGRGETAEALKAQAMRKANLHARWFVAGAVLAPVLVPVLAWSDPRALAAVGALAVFGLVVKLIPGRGWQEVVGAAVAAAAVWWFLPTLIALIPRPPVWALVVVFAALTFALGWIGRPRGKTLTGGTQYAMPTKLVKPTAEMVVDALCRSGIPGMTLQAADRVHAEIRVIAPGVAATPHGYLIEMELPPGVTVDMVVKQRAPLAAALRRDLSTVWPSGNTERHPGYLRLFLSYEPMTKARQPVWPVAAGEPLSCFDPIPMFTDEQQRWVSITLAGTHMVMGGSSGSGKSVGLRQLGVALAFALDTRIIVFDGKLSGDLNPIRSLCHGFYEGAEPEDVAKQIGCLKWLVAERQRRALFLAALPRDENRHSKVTAELAAKYPKQLAPIVVLFDEVQEYTEYGVKGNAKEMAIRTEFVALLTKLARLARSAGIVMVFVSQKPDATVLPTAIMGNCGIRVAFRVLEQQHNDQVLGTSARKNGIDATMFTLQDRGIAWVRGGEAANAMVARTWSEMVDLDVADELATKAYAMRKAAGLLTGAAAEDATPDTDDVVRLVDDVREVMDVAGADRMHLVVLLDRLALLRSELYGVMDVAGLGAALRGAGVEVKDQMKVGSRNTSGVLRAALDEPDEPDDGAAVVVPIR